MQRSKYFNQTKPTETQLNWTEDSRSNVVERRARSFMQFGTLSGFQITVNSTDATKIDIARGEGYSGGFYPSNNYRGLGTSERISTYADTLSGEVDLGPAGTNIGLADYTVNAQNYITLVYGENESVALSERSYPFTPHNTIVTETFSVSVLTAAQWAALTETQINNRILIGIVTGNGAGNALTSANITQVTQPKQHPVATIAMGGVTVQQLGDNTPYGTATLRWDGTKLYWTAPGDTEGAGVTISDSAQYTLYSNNTNYWIIVTVIAGTIALVAATSESVSITGLYGRTLPMASAIDQMHRDLLGTGNVAVNNPHGLSIDDITGGTFDHADFFHVNGISNDSSAGFLQCSANPLNNRIDIANPGGARDRYLIDGVMYDSITGTTAPASASIVFGAGDADGRYLIYLDSGGNPQKVFLGADFDTDNVYIVDMYNSTVGNGIIDYDSATYRFNWQAPGDAVAGNDVGVTKYDSDGSVATTGIGYYKLYSDTTDNWIIIYLDGTAPLAAYPVTINNIAFNSTDQSEDKILRLCSVTWDSAAGNFFHLEDLRVFVTADNKTEGLEEHDVDGAHTVPLRNTLRVVNTGAYAVVASAQSYAMVVTVEGNNAFSAYAENNAILGVVSDETAMYGYGVASVICGTAQDGVGVFGSGVDTLGVVGKAASTAILGSALANTGVYGKALASIGVYGSAVSNYGIMGECNSNLATAIYGVASGSAGKAIAGEHVGTGAGIGVRGEASNSAQGGRGGYFVASNTVVGTGVYGRADGGSGAFGVVGSAIAEDATGVAGYGGSIGVYGRAVTAGSPSIMGQHYAAGGTAIYGVVPNSGLAGLFEATAVGAVGISITAEAIGLDVAGVDTGANIVVTGAPSTGLMVVANADGPTVYGVSAEATGDAGIAIRANGEQYGGYFMGSTAGINGQCSAGGSYGVRAYGGNYGKYAYYGFGAQTGLGLAVNTGGGCIIDATNSVSQDGAAQLGMRMRVINGGVGADASFVSVQITAANRAYAGPIGIQGAYASGPTIAVNQTGALGDNWGLAIGCTGQNIVEGVSAGAVGTCDSAYGLRGAGNDGTNICAGVSAAGNNAGVAGVVYGGLFFAGGGATAIGAYASGDDYGARIVNTIDYHIDFAGAGDVHSYVPIQIKGTQYKLAIYSNA